VYPLRDVRSDQRVLEIMWDIVMVNRTNQRWDVVQQDRQDLLRISQIIAVFASLLCRCLARWRGLESTVWYTMDSLVARIITVGKK
jgi:hypothetical protein